MCVIMCVCVCEKATAYSPNRLHFPYTQIHLPRLIQNRNSKTSSGASLAAAHHVTVSSVTSTFHLPYWDRKLLRKANFRSPGEHL